MSPQKEAATTLVEQEMGYGLDRIVVSLFGNMIDRYEKYQSPKRHQIARMYESDPDIHKMALV